MLTERRHERTVGVGDGRAEEAGDFVLVTFALGSCVGMTMWDPLARVGGMLHSQLPVSYQNEARASAHPFLFTDTAVTELLRLMYSLGAERSRVIARIAGCAARTEDSTFRVGERNLAVARRVLWRNDIVVKGEAVGGTAPRTMILDMESGVTSVRSDGETRTI